jgi:DNA invertase Pin-like site-specific DNA recombinase
MNNFIVDCAANCIVTTNDPTAKCKVGYTRFSSEGQDENSTAYQTHAIIEHCKKNNIRLVKIFSDEAYTGTNDNRPSFQAMIAEANNDPVWDEIIVFDYSRFSRNVYDCVMYKRMFDDLHMELTSVKEDFG